MKTQTQTITTKRLLVAGLVIISGLSLISCGPQKVQSNVATTPQSNVASSYDTSGRPVASCSHDIANLSDLSIRLETYSNNGVENTNWIRVKFDRFPSNFTSSSSAIAFWSRTVDSNGNNLPMTSAPFFLEVKNGGVFSQISSEMTELTWANLMTIAGQNSVSTSSAQSALASISFVVKLDNAGSASVMSAALYYSGSAADRYVEALIPKFFANPTDYASNHPNTLVNLHPLKYMLGGSWTAEQFVSESQKYCF